MHKSCYQSRVNTGKDPFFEKKRYKNWRANDTDELIDTATLVPNINVIAPKSNKIHGTGWQCHMSKLFTIYYKTFLRNAKMSFLKPLIYLRPTVNLWCAINDATISI
jgi:hypothetical protein